VDYKGILHILNVIKAAVNFAVLDTTVPVNSAWASVREWRSDDKRDLKG